MDRARGFDSHPPHEGNQFPGTKFVGIAEGTKIVTTNASKHGLRAAATERRNRHAQRTPLPPRAGAVAEAKEVLTAVGIAPGTVVVDSLTAVQAAVVDAKPTGAPDRSLAKAQAFAALCSQYGWDVAIAPVGDAVELTATRGAETIVQAWSGGVWDYAASFYAFGDRNTKPRNASGASKLLQRAADDAAAEATKVQANRHFRKAEPKDITTKLDQAQRRLPFDPELATDEEISGVLAGQALTWYNRISRGTESAMVSRKGVRISLTPAGERVVTFCCPVTGYRACLVTAILKVGRGRSLVTKGTKTENAAVEVA